METPDFSQRVAEHRRLCLLRALAEEPAGRLRRDLLLLLVAAEGQANVSLLTDGLVDLGHPVARDQVATTAAWCVAQGLAVERPHSDYPGWHVTDAGGEAAVGRSRVPGVQPPATVDWLVLRLGELSVSITREQVILERRWLVERSLVRSGLMADTVSLTLRGAEVAAGKLTVEGVKKPSFGAMLNAAATVGKSILGG